MRFLVNVLYLAAAVLYLPVLLYQMLVQGKNRRGWRQRFGHWPIAPGQRPRIWVHAVSLGEINATPLLVAELQKRLPDHDFVISTTTDTGYARACKVYGADRVFRFPLDFSWVVRRVLRLVQPAMIVLVELEVWYNLVRTATQRGIPVAVVNGRLTERSQRRFRRVGPLVRPMFRDLAWVGAQDEVIAGRFVRLGVPPERVEVTGSIKWDTTTVSDTIDGADALAAATGIDGQTPLWVCGSTGPDEEAIILDAYARLVEAIVPVRLAVIPRKPERFDEVADLIQNRGYACLRRSQHADGSEGVGTRQEAQGTRQQGYEATRQRGNEATRQRGNEATRQRGNKATRQRGNKATRQQGNKATRQQGSEATEQVHSPFAIRHSLFAIHDRPDEESTGGDSAQMMPVVLGDTMGELRKFYSLAQVVFVGRSLVPLGGSDPMEAAALAKPIVVGPHTDNFAAPVAAFAAAGAIRVIGDARALASAVFDLLTHPEAAQDQAARARQVVLDHQGATARTAECLTAVLSGTRESGC